MNWRKTSIVFRKELLDTLRDHRFLVSSILIPILLFPLMTVGFGGFAFFMARRTQQLDQSVMVIGAQHAPALVKALEKLRGIEIVAPAPDYVRRINEKKLQAAVEIPAGLEEQLKSDPDRKQTIKIYHYQEDLRSQTALRAITRAIDDYSKEVASGRLTTRGLSIELLTPFRFERESVASAERVTGNILGFILPYMIILLCLTGAMYPAMDITAGEKERGTMETILASPAGRLDIVIGKFLLVLLVSVFTTAISLGSMAGTVLLGAGFLTRIGPNLVLQVSWKALAAVLFLILPLAVLFSAALLAISVFARNYKEAQGYIGPLMFLVILPAMGSFVPGIELNTRIAMIPILSVSLLAKEILGGHFPLNHIALIFGSTSVYAIAALYFALRQFRKEEVLFRT